MNKQPSIFLSNESAGFEIDEPHHIRFVSDVCIAINKPDAEVSVSLISEKEMRELNHQYRGKDEPTDVLSFAMLEGERVGNENTLGDIIISYETAMRQAQTYQHSIQNELNELLFHGMMHFIGFDHETGMSEWREKELQLIQALKNMKSAYIPIGLSGVETKAVHNQKIPV